MYGRWKVVSWIAEIVRAKCALTNTGKSNEIDCSREYNVSRTQSDSGVERIGWEIARNALGRVVRRTITVEMDEPADRHRERYETDTRNEPGAYA